jgi:ubiquinone/menaquinone biosynthesis C-methylase UbiE
VFAARERPGWEQSLRDLIDTLQTLPPATTLDVACGTGFLTRHLAGAITGLDQSERMLTIARERVPEATFVRGDALLLPFGDAEFERVFTAHFYGHLDRSQRTRFLEQARRVGSELVVVDSAVRPDHEPEEWQQRVLNDGSRFQVFKRYFTAQGLSEELGGGAVLHESPWFVAVRYAASSGEGSR